jgi:hypothetical protein
MNLQLFFAAVKMSEHKYKHIAPVGASLLCIPATSAYQKQQKNARCMMLSLLLSILKGQTNLSRIRAFYGCWLHL